MKLVHKLCLYIILFCILLSVVLLKRILQDQWRADSIRYEMQMQCVQYYINAGIERSAIRLNNGGCEVIQ